MSADRPQDPEGARATHPNTPLPEIFRRFAHSVAEKAGSATAFLLALLIVILWLCSGPYFRFSDTWQLVINTGTTIVTFLMVFLIQNTQNRDAREIHLKLDELIRSHKTARNDFIDLDRLSDAEMEQALLDIRSRRSAAIETTDG